MPEYAWSMHKEKLLNAWQTWRFSCRRCSSLIWLCTVRAKTDFSIYLTLHLFCTHPKELTKASMPTGTGAFSEDFQRIIQSLNLTNVCLWKWISVIYMNKVW